MHSPGQVCIYDTPIPKSMSNTAPRLYVSIRKLPVVLRGTILDFYGRDVLREMRNWALRVRVIRSGRPGVRPKRQYRCPPSSFNDCVAYGYTHILDCCQHTSIQSLRGLRMIQQPDGIEAMFDLHEDIYGWKNTFTHIAINAIWRRDETMALHMLDIIDMDNDHRSYERRVLKDCLVLALRANMIKVAVLYARRIWANAINDIESCCERANG